MTLDRLPYEDYGTTNCSMCGFPVGSPECRDTHFEMQKARRAITSLREEKVQSIKHQSSSREELHPYLCFAHGGSDLCEESNKEHGFDCPICSKEEKEPIELSGGLEYVLTVCPLGGESYFQYISAASSQEAKQLAKRTMKEKSPKGVCSWKLAKIDKFIL